MSRVSYFQYYKKDENSVTNNTLLLLKYIYQENPRKIEAILNSLINGDLVVGLEFENQIKGEYSVPDGHIKQDAFNIYIETKLGDNQSDDQILRHIKSIKHSNSVGKKYLLCLSKNKIKSNLEDSDVLIIHTTFRELLEKIEDEIEDWEVRLKDIVEDYRENIKKLIPSNFIMFASNCGVTIDLNAKYGIYYDNSNRPTREIAQYIGLYKDKKVNFIGKIKSVITYGGGENFDFERGDVNENDKIIINEIIKETKEKTHYEDLSLIKHRYFVVDKFYSVKFTKDTKGAMRGLKYFDLEKYGINENDDIKKIAQKLNNKKWQI